MINIKHMILVCLLGLYTNCSKDMQHDEIAIGLDMVYYKSDGARLQLYINRDGRARIIKRPFNSDSLIIERAIVADTTIKWLFNINTNASIEKVNREYDRILTVCERTINSVSFAKNKKILLSVDSYSYILPNILDRIMVPLRDETDKVFQKVGLEENSSFFCKMGGHAGFRRKNETYDKMFRCNLAESCLLSSYLCTGKVTDTVLYDGYEFGEESPQIPAPKGSIFPKIPIVRNAITDGRYYTFEFLDSTITTIDIGVNFLTYTMQERFEAWQKEMETSQ